jgi:hypothetical protein
MRRQALAVAASFATLLLLMSSPSPAATTLPSLTSITDALVGPLASKFGLSNDQVMGGLGSMLTLAKEKLAAGDFDKIAAAIPGAKKYLDKAKSLGAVAGPLANMAGLTGALGKLGIKPETAAQFIPAARDMMGTVGGADVSKLLSSVFK